MPNFEVEVGSGQFRNTVELVLLKPVDTRPLVDEFTAFVRRMLETTPIPPLYRHVLIVDLTRTPNLQWVNPIISLQLAYNLIPLVADVLKRFDTCLYRVPTEAYKVASELIVKLFPKKNGELVHCFGPLEGEALERTRRRASHTRCGSELRDFS